ncbi:hypothetical protein B296_00058598 [Ensete ventricosum]|uniref:Uncharacterized protein n=1 Tax=Ensete ventricosum TaxID=4639 RepID=A0A426WW98_ENSVE|nr:hypothetical protein B296_00058598 [Ensete ventricosum]
MLNDRKSCAKLKEVKGIANSKVSVLMQGLVHGRPSVRAHPKARSELDAMEHQSFLFDVERIRPSYWATDCPRAMLRVGVTQEWVDESELPRERTKNNQRWRRPYDVLAETTHGEVKVDSGEHHSVAEVDLPIAKGCRYKVTDRRAGLTALWYHRNGTSVESSIPYSHGGRALVVKGTEEVENAEANSKYQDRMEGQRPWNFIRPMSMGFSSR